MLKRAVRVPNSHLITIEGAPSLNRSLIQGWENVMIADYAEFEFEPVLSHPPSTKRSKDGAPINQWKGMGGPPAIEGTSFHILLRAPDLENIHATTPFGTASNETAKTVRTTGTISERSSYEQFSRHQPWTFLLREIATAQKTCLLRIYKSMLHPQQYLSLDKLREHTVHLQQTDHEVHLLT